MADQPLPPDQRTLYPIPELHPLVPGPASLPSYYPLLSSPSGPPTLCIDNGATTLRAGFSSADSPAIEIDNINAKYRDRKSNRAVMLSGGEVYVDATSRSNVRSPFEGDVVCNFDVMENILDYVLLKMGVTTETLRTPVVMTETLCNPSYSRSLMTELLFESYGAPSVAYGIDSLFSFYNNSPNPFTADGLVISSSTANTHVIPVLNGRGILTSAKKLAWGGSQAAEYMLKLMQLKYPTFPGRLSSFQSGIMYRDHCYNATPTYADEIRAFQDPRTMVARDRVVQFPFVALQVEEKTEEEIQRQLEKRKEATRRLQEQAAKQRMEKMERQQEELVAFGELKALRPTLKKADFDKRLKDAGFSSPEDLDDYLKKTEKSLTRARNKELGIEESEGKEPPSFPLIDVPDHTLNEDDLREKRRQRLMKAGYDARIRLKAEKEDERRRVEERERRDRELRESDFGKWLDGLRREHEDIMTKMKERKKRKEQLSDRKSLAAQNRMKSIAGLAADEKAGRKRKRGEQDDGFGQSDADWAVYREIGTGDDSEDEEDELSALKSVEARLLEHDPLFTPDHTAERLSLRSHQLLNAFVRGLAPDDPLDTYDPESAAHNSQLHVNVERVRVPEVLWQPVMGGLDQAGLAEVVEGVLRGFAADERARLTKNIFLTGGNTLVPLFSQRLRASLTPSLPIHSPLNIVRSYDPAAPGLDAWRGMAKWSGTDEGKRAFVSRQEYEEKGSEWFKEHGWGNRAL
ncbi:hypothetical protein JCM21900_003317 [Sporobolomyces salmonicolor]